MTEAEPLDIDRYLARIAYEGGLEPTLTTLTRLHHALVAHIPFENLDVQLGLPIRLDLESLQAKIVGREWDGHCVAPPQSWDRSGFENLRQPC
jgi:N-hydroxyarylamine O-acetyltransferase